MGDAAPHRGEVWQIDFEPVRGHEQGRRRPAVILSTDAFNAGPAELVVVCPLTTRDRGIRFHVPVRPPEGGVRAVSFVLCDQIRAVATERLTVRIGVLGAASLEAIEERLKILLDL